MHCTEEGVAQAGRGKGPRASKESRSTIGTMSGAIEALAGALRGSAITGSLGDRRWGGKTGGTIGS